MDLLFESGLFAELEEVAGCDPALYEDTQKQLDFNTSSLDEYGDLDGLLTQNNQLLDQLVSSSDLEMPIDISIDLAEIDEISAKLDCVQDTLTSVDKQDLLADLEHFSSSEDYPIAVSPTSSIATLPSEPSSPIDLGSLLQTEPQHSPADFTDLLQSLLDDDDNKEVVHAPAFADDFSDDFSDQSILSPKSEVSYLISQTASDDSYDDTLSTYSSHSAGIGIGPYTETKSKKKPKSTPYSKLPTSRKDRKKKQNKEAAIRYREKKRKEAQEVLGEESRLTDKNIALKTEVLNLQREIMCMKELLSDVFNIHSL
ncbi:cyclic AMP-dependent transcription factor ATF-5-like [Watersipora subatra]|uniref:cyclic AMP-dependent transcription factor ATF-5-like n=1 Tax=Watersipora subatra TaxID=2589382 RepID=UPI00355C3F08